MITGSPFAAIRTSQLPERAALSGRFRLYFARICAKAVQMKAICAVREFFRPILQVPIGEIDFLSPNGKKSR